MPVSAVSLAIVPPERNFVPLVNLLAIGQVAFFLTTSLWWPPFGFPQVPLLAVARDWPIGVDVVAFVGSLSGMFLQRRAELSQTGRLRHGVCALSFAVLFLLNQHRVQTWAYQFFILHVWLTLAQPRHVLVGWRWLTISIYVYSAMSKFDYGFCMQHGPFLWDGFLHVWGFPHGTANWPASLRFLAAASMPITEFLAALALCFQRTQRLGLVMSIVMHGFLLVTLSPWGHNHSLGVLLWNGFFIVQNLLLFPGPVALSSLGTWKPAATRSKIAWGFLMFFLIAPVGEPFGLWDHWPSWAVYAARPAKTSVFIHEDDLLRIPPELQRYLQPPAPLDVWHPIRLDRWSLDVAKVPIYPETRFHVGVALAFAERCQIATMKIEIDSPPNRWTGERTRKESVGLEAIHQLAATFRLNAQPRSFEN